MPTKRNEDMLLTQSQLNSCFLSELEVFTRLAPASFLLKEVLLAWQGCFSSHSYSPLIWNLSMREAGSAVAPSECLSRACLGLQAELASLWGTCEMVKGTSGLWRVKAETLGHSMGKSLWYGTILFSQMARSQPYLCSLSLPCGFPILGLRGDARPRSVIFLWWNPINMKPKGLCLLSLSLCHASWGWEALLPIVSLRNPMTSQKPT